MTSRSLIVAVWLVAVVQTGCLRRNSVRQGREDAQRDIAAGVLKIKTTQSSGAQPWVTEYRELLKERHGIGWEVIGGDPPSGEEQQYVEVYNRVVDDEITRRFGDGVIGKAMDDARELHNAKFLSGKQ